MNDTPSSEVTIKDTSRTILSINNHLFRTRGTCHVQTYYQFILNVTQKRNKKKNSAVMSLADA